MSIQDLGSIGELVAAVATVATLIYLSIQIRNNTRSDEFAAMERVTADLSDFSLRLLQNEQHGYGGRCADGSEHDAEHRHHDDATADTEQASQQALETLEAKEKFEVRLALQAVFMMAWRAYEAHQNGRLSDKSWHLMIALLRNSYFPSATVSSWFANYFHLYPEEFVHFVNKELEDAQRDQDA